MPATEPTKVRNIAVAGHRGVGKTSLVEALLFEAEKTNRLGSVEQGTTVSDWDEHEQKRAMSLSGSLCHLEWKDRKINLVDTPGDAGFQADTYAALRVVEGVVLVLSGVMGVEVNTSRVWKRAEEQELSRVLFVNMLDRERADFYRVLEAARQQLSDRCVAIQLPIGSEHELTGIVDLLHVCAYTDPSGGHEGGPQPIPDSMTDLVQEHREKLLDAVVETDEELMGRYLEGEELATEAVADALKQAVTRDELYPVACGVASKNLGTTALLDLLVEGVPSPAKKGTTIEFGDAKQAVFIFKTIADPFTGRISCFRVLAGPVSGDTTLVDPRTHAKERLGQVLLLQGKDSEAVDALGIGDLGAVAKLKDVVTGDVLVDHEVAVEPPHIDFPEPVMSFAVTPKAKGDEEKMGTGLRRLHEEDPTLIMRRDPQTGERAGATIKGARVVRVDGVEHNVDSSEMAFKSAGSMAFKEAYAKADPVLLEPSMQVEVAVPDDAVGAVNGDLNSRRGRLQGMEPAAGMTMVKAEVPMAEILTYSQALTSMTGGRGDYSMHFLRYEEVPTHVAQKIIEQTKKEREEAKV